MSLFDPIKPLLKVYKPEIQGWWIYPNQNRMLIEAILIQQTTSTNVAKAIKNLTKLGVLDQPYQDTWSRILNMSEDNIEKAIYPSGFFRIKTQRLLSFAEWIKSYNFDFNRIKKMGLSQLRKELNHIKGIGPETADVMILYVFNYPVFITDNYCLQYYKKLGLIESKATYKSAQKIFESQPDMTTNYKVAQHWHAAIDEHGKNPDKLN